ncbi:MAG: hypothetical protein A3G41_09120 [Elusimicrobia bacterium RIFCSPLOWO2_12_FULL_59_9]|nr:MAG: hypothetical protein A3G41_09120 [Elusimicrobia bacterium RIFCSPLOWO2_12_FULL_59_9]
MIREDLKEIFEQRRFGAQNYEALLVGFLAAAAFLMRGMPVASSRYLWWLGVALAANLLLLRLHGRHSGWPPPMSSGGQRSRNSASGAPSARNSGPGPRGGPPSGWASLISLGVNSLLVAYLIDSSGGRSSMLWPLFLLPVFTAGFYLPGWAMRACGLHVALLLCFYLEPLRGAEASAWFEISLKAGFLFASSYFIGRLGAGERQALKIAQARREELIALSRRCLSVQDSLDDSRKTLTRSLSELGDRITLILGAVQLLQESMPQGAPEQEDLKRILEAARQSGDTARNLTIQAHLFHPSKEQKLLLRSGS